MFATASTHLPHPCDVVVDHVIGEGAAPWTWLPELRRSDDRPFAELGAGSELELDLGVGRRSEVVALRTREVVRTTVAASGTTAAGDEVDLCLSTSPWDGGTAVVLSIDVAGAHHPLLSWSLTRRLETALVRLAGELATARSAVGSARP